MKPVDRDRQEAQDRHRLQHVEDRDQQLFGALALGRDRRVGEAEDQRGDQRRDHAQHGAQPVLRQVRADRARSATLRRDGSGTLICRLAQAIRTIAPSTSGNAMPSQ